MADEKARSSLKLSNGLRISVFVGLLAIFAQLAVVIWGAALLTARVTTIEVDHIDMKTVTRTVQTSVNKQAIDIGQMRVQIDNIDDNVERLLDQ